MRRKILRNIPWLLSFFIGTPAVILLSLFTLQRMEPSAVLSAPRVLSASIQNLDTSGDLFLNTMLSPQFITSDARPIIIKNYLHNYASPLEPYSRLIVQISDKYSLDYRLLVAIAQQESNLCKKIPPGSHNCWGYGIYGNQTLKFDNYPEALETVASGLKKNYIDQGLNTPEKIMAKYTPPSVDIGGPWAKGVTQFFSEME